MKATHVKYTVEFDIPIKIDDSVMNIDGYEYVQTLFENAVKVQWFYFKKEGSPPYSTRAKNIKISKECTLQDYVI